MVASYRLCCIIFCISVTHSWISAQPHGINPVFPNNILLFKDAKDLFPFIKFMLPDAPMILEAGAYNGADTMQLAAYWPKSIVYAFEPIPELYKQVVSRVKNIPNIKTFCQALGSKVGTALMYTSENPWAPGIVSASSSLLEPKEHLIYSPVQFKNKIEVEETTIDAWAKIHNIQKIDMLWLDMQGYELSALKSSLTILKEVKVIITEVEFVEAYKGQPLFDEVKKFLETQGFTLIAINPFYQWFGDALFVRC